MHHKPENRGAYVDNKKYSFFEVKICNGLHHCVPLVEMVKRHVWNAQFGVRMRELCLQENICLGYRYFRSILPVRDRNFQWLAEKNTVLRESELPVLPVRDQNFRWGPELSVEPD
jgi:hypothetical protein